MDFRYILLEMNKQRELDSLDYFSITDKMMDHSPTVFRPAIMLVDLAIALISSLGREYRTSGLP